MASGDETRSMSTPRWISAAFVVVILLVEAGATRAARTPSLRTASPRSSGARSDITVPYLTTGRTTFMATSVAPRIYSSPIVDDPGYPQMKPVYNLIYYGSKQAFGGRSNGATDRTR